MLGIKLLVCYTHVIEHSKVSFKYIILSLIAFQEELVCENYEHTK